MMASSWNLGLTWENFKEAFFGQPESDADEMDGEGTDWQRKGIYSWEMAHVIAFLRAQPNLSKRQINTMIDAVEDMEFKGENLVDLRSAKHLKRTLDLPDEERAEEIFQAVREQIARSQKQAAMGVVGFFKKAETGDEKFHEESFDLFVQGLPHGTKKIPGIKASMTIKEVKQRITEEEGENEDGISLVVGGLFTENGRTLGSYGVTSSRESVTVAFKTIGGKVEGQNELIDFPF